VRQISRDKAQKKEGNSRNLLRGLDRRKTRRRRRSTARAELRFGFLGGGSVEERRSSGEWCGLEGSSGAPFIGGEGRGRDRGGGRRRSSGLPLMVEAQWGSRYRERKGRGRLLSKCGTLMRGYWDAEAARGKGERHREGDGRCDQGRKGGGGR
jgi:hypothetical protein